METRRKETNRKQRKCSVILLLLLPTIFFACSNKETLHPTDNDTFLSVKHVGVDNLSSDIQLKGATKKESSDKFFNDGFTSNDFDADLSLEMNGPVLPSTKASGNAPSDASSVASSISNLDNGIKYLLIIYDPSTTKKLSETECTVGSDSKIPVEAGRSYKWVAVSYNEPMVPSVSQNSIEADNRDVLWASGELTIKKGQNSLNINFTRKTVKYEVELDSRGLFGTFQSLGKIKWLNAEKNQIIKKGTLNILSGEYSSITAASVSPTAPVIHGTKGVASFYSVSPMQFDDTQVPIVVSVDGGINIRRDDHSILKLAGKEPANFTFSTLPKEEIPLGSRLKINIQLVESPIVVGGVQWARTNLKYDPNLSEKYRFRVDNEYAIPSEDNEYWIWNATTPTGKFDSGDPCKLVYPQNKWRLPNLDEYKKIEGKDIESLRGNKTVLTDGVRYSATWDLDKGEVSNDAYPINSRKLFIGYYGHSRNNFMSAGFNNPYITLYGVHMSYQTSDLIDNDHFNIFSYYIWPMKNTFENTFEVAGHGLPKENVRTSIRCVRNEVLLMRP